MKERQEKTTKTRNYRRDGKGALFLLALLVSLIAAFSAPVRTHAFETGTVYYYGDANQDGEVGAVDALQVLQHCVQLSKLTGDALTLADVDQNGKIEATDALMILQITVNLLDKEDYTYALQGSGIYSISDMRIEDGVVYAVVNTKDAAELEILFYDETTEEALPASAKISLPADKDLTEVSGKISGALPEHYIAVAQMVDGDGASLCSQYTCLSHTTNYELFMAQTVNDFPDDVVVNFDDDETTNFGVLADDVIVVESSREANTLTANADGTYTLANADSATLNLRAGDVIAVFAENGETQMLSAAAVKVDGASVTVVPDEESTLKDYYDVLKVDMGIAVDDSMADLSGADDGVSLLTGVTTASYNSGLMASSLLDIGFEDTFEKGINFKLDETFGAAKVTGEVALTATLTVSMHYDIHLLGEDYFECGFKLELESHLDGEVKVAENSKDDKGEESITLAQLTVPTGVPGLTVSLHATLPLDLSGNVTLHAGASITRGYSYNTLDGAHVIADSEAPSLDVDGKITFRGGVKVALSAEFLLEVIKAEVSAQAGLKIEATVSDEETAGEATGDSIHVCGLCVEGEAGPYVEANINLSYRITDKIKGTPVDYTPVNQEATLVTFSKSVLNDADSPLGGQSVFYWHKCVNRKYKTTVTAVNESGKTLADAKITVKKADGTTVGTYSSGETVYLYTGKYTVAAETGSGSGTTEVTVAARANNVKVTVESNLDVLEAYREILRRYKSSGYALFNANQTGTMRTYSDEWFDTTGILSATVLDFDLDGTEEMLVCIAEKCDHENSNFDYSHIMMYMYDVQDGKVSQTASTLLGAYYPEGTKESLLMGAEADNELKAVSVAKINDKCFILCENRCTTAAFSDGTYQSYWVMEYTDGAFVYVGSFSQTRGGSIDFEFTGYTFENGKCTSATLYYSEWTESSPLYRDFEQAINAFFNQYNITVNSISSLWLERTDLHSVFSDKNEKIKAFELAIGLVDGDYKSGKYTFSASLTRGNTFLEDTMTD